MESVFDIIKCMETGIFKQATTNARIEMLKQQYEKDIEKAFPHLAKDIENCLN